MVNPPASHVLREDEVLVVMGSAEALEALPSR
jgi:trk system potassium uptake protein TrkA